MSCPKCDEQHSFAEDQINRRIAVLGMPNTGKSTFFNRFTGAQAHIGNWPGVTVDLNMATVCLGTHLTQVIDLPGIYDLRGFSEDEAVVRRFLETTPLHLVIIILNLSQIDRQLSLALQVKQLQLPTVLLLNMADEAPQFGVSVDVQRLASLLEMPVVSLSAKYGIGLETTKSIIADALAAQTQPARVQSLEAQLSSDADLADALAQVLNEVMTTTVLPRNHLTTQLDRFFLHPVLGLPIFLSVMLLVFQSIYALGTPIQNGIGQGLDWFKTTGLEPALAFLPNFPKSFLIYGLYDGIGTVLTFVPIIFLFFLCMAIVEDSGYLSRSAFLMDAFMERLGLDGRSFVMSLMGFGCNVPAIMGTRVMRSPALRMLSMLVIPFSLCSARLNVFIFMTTALFAPPFAPLVLFSLYLLSFAAAILTAALFKGKFPNREPFVLELPPYRWPTLKHLWVRSWSEIKHFWRWASRFIVFGVIAIWLLNNLPPGVPPASDQTLSGMIGHWAQPILAPLGITPQLTVALIFGFIAKEIVLGGLAVIYGTAGNAGLSAAITQQIDAVQAYSFMLFTLLYTPCLSTVAVIRTESKRWTFTLFTVAWSLGLAWLVSFVFYQSARIIGF